MLDSLKLVGVSPADNAKAAYLMVYIVLLDNNDIHSRKQI